MLSKIQVWSLLLGDLEGPHTKDDPILGSTMVYNAPNQLAQIPARPHQGASRLESGGESAVQHPKKVAFFERVAWVH